ncbi:hypothetical protein F5884DRAFT_227707 [Xylogone sp. PMI_703]|nr:hypothetical protein F5884DRAFT_227707 [Xylogone sp. PMI_703]
MSDYQYRSAFDSSSNVVPTPVSTNADSSERAEITPPSSEEFPSGTLASFVCHVANLEKILRHEKETVFFDTDSEIFGSKVDIGRGATFRVQRAEWRRKDAATQANGEKKWGKYVAIKSVLPTRNSKEIDWQDVFLEVRALLHEPLRYHPNIVRLLGFGWGTSDENSTVLPQLVIEFSEIGSMETLQKYGDPLPFSVKQKLCYDVGRGLSILHACGIVHGDLTHANVLIFKSRVRVPGLPFTAKLSDFGGSVMDMTRHERHSLRMTTWPFSAPECGGWLSADGIKQTDVYSFGLFIWRTLLDCKNILQIFELDGKRTPSAETQIAKLKLSDDFLRSALYSVESYVHSNGLSETCFILVRYALLSTIQTNPSLRSLARAQCALMGLNLEMIPQHIRTVETRNEQETLNQKSSAPGSHGASRDSLGAHLGRLGHDYDAQNNTPGYRPSLSHPDTGDFHFDPYRFKEILSWSQQVLIVNEFERIAASKSHENGTELQWWMAAFYLFQCYLVEFGVTYDPERACFWLARAAEEEDSGGVNYLAQAWIWRISHALNVQCTPSMETIKLYMKLSILRGHRTCLVDGRKIINSIQDASARAQWAATLNEGELFLGALSAGLGMPYFTPRKLRRPYNFNDLAILDDQIRDELGEDYESCLKDRQPANASGADDSNPDDSRKRKTFESIYVNHIGHGLLHLAASYGRVDALRHMIQKYKVNINVEDRTAYETPLVCACRSNQIDCVRFLLETGANPRSTQFGVESPLCWLSTFQEKQMREVAKMLFDAGAVVDEGGQHTMRPDIRVIWADWEQLFSVRVSPLGRAVIMNNITAVDVLLGYGADPALRPFRKSTAPGTSAIELAALLNLPDILEKLLAHFDAKPDPEFVFFDECALLEMAHKKTVFPTDTTSLQSRLVRHGEQYKTALFRTLEILRKRGSKYHHQENPFPCCIRGAALCHETRLGNTDIVECLLRLGHPVNGSPGYRPLKEAVHTNNAAIFQILVAHGADIHVSYEADDGSTLSLLQVSAGHPKAMRPGTYIEEYLIKKGVPVEPDNGTRPALAYALLNHNLRLADLLLAKGANINKVYQAEKDGPWITVLAELAQKHTEANLKSIEYILQLAEPEPQPQKEKTADQSSLASLLKNMELITELTPPPKPSTAPDFIVDKTHSLSIIQVLADLPPQAMVSTAQISSRIIDTILRAFPHPEQINHVHEFYGSALCMAAMSSNMTVISALLEHNASRHFLTNIPRLDEAHKSRLAPVQPSDTPTAMNLAIAVATKYVTQLIATMNTPQTVSDSVVTAEFLESLQDKLSIIEILADEQTMRQDQQLWTTKVPAVMKQFEMVIPKRRREAAGGVFVAGQGNYPVDLSELPERETRAWREGEEMDEEQAVSTMLNFMRK